MLKPKRGEVSNIVIRNWVMKGPSKIGGVLKRLESDIVSVLQQLYQLLPIIESDFLFFWTRRSAHIPENGASTKYITRRNNDCH